MATKKSFLFSLLIILISSVCNPVWTYGCIIYVDAGATGANNGLSWTNAYKYLQDALTVAEPNCEIWVAQGTYRPDEDTVHPGGTGDRTATFQLKSGVAIYGGFPTGGGQWTSRDPNIYKSILSGSIGTPDVNDNIYHVVTGSDTNETAVLDGFTITSGYAWLGCYWYDCGGGMYNENGSPTIANCTFSGNWAHSDQEGGGGMYNKNGSPIITNCTFSGNVAYNGECCGHGGGMYNENGSPTITNCTFSENYAQMGSGMYNRDSNAMITNCIFSGNGNSYPCLYPPCYFYCFEGGGICNSGGSPTITNCIFTGNGATRGGGGIHNFGSNPTVTNCTFSGNTQSGICNSGSSPTITDCNFSGNWAIYLLSTDRFGGGMSNGGGSPTITNCTFSGNWTIGPDGDGFGGGMSNLVGYATITNCTFSGNWTIGLLGDGYGGGMCNRGYATITNCTFSGNSATYGGGICSKYGTTNIINCILYNDTASSDGNEIALRLLGGIWSGIADVNYSDVQGGQAAVHIDPCCILNWGPGNIDADPCFVEPGYWDVNGTPDDANDDFWVDGNYRLLSNSPCIDAGDNNSVPLYCRYADLDGRWRIADGNGDGYCVVDMGAYEFPSDIYVHIGDFDNSCDVDFQDFAILASAWLTKELLPWEPGYIPGYKPICDISQPIDQKIDMRDLKVFCEHWLEGTGP